MQLSPARKNFSLPHGVRLLSDRAASISVSGLTKASETKWDQFVAGHPDGTIFHSLQWRNLISSVYGHEPFYLTAFDSERLIGVLPMFLINSSLGGRMMVSVPYAVGGGVLASDHSVASALRDHALNLASANRCATLELRSEEALFSDVPVLDRYVGFSRELPNKPEDVLEWIPRKARAAARNARDKFGLTIAFRHTDLRTVWRLYTRNMRRLASIAYPFRFFTSIRGNLRGTHWICVVKRKDEPMASLVTLMFGDRVMPYLVGFGNDARRCNAANFLYYSVMQKAVASGYRIFDFGRSRIDNVGSCNFKRFHGFEPIPLGYQRIIVSGRPRMDLSPSNPAFDAARRVWPYLPLRLTEAVGGFLSYHIPG